MKTRFFLQILLIISLQANAQVWDWAIKDGGINNDVSNAVAKDRNGNVYICGYFISTSTFGANPLTSAGLKDVFIARYDSTGINNWAIRAGGTGDDVATGIETDSAGNLYVTGTFSGTALFDTCSLTSSGSTDIFIAKYNSSGSCLWARRCGGSNSDNSVGIVGDVGGNVYITGMFSAIATFDTISRVSNGVNDMFIAAYNSSGHALWVMATGGYAGTVTPRSISIDAGNAIYVCGNIQGNVKIGNDSLVSDGGYDMFMSKFSITGSPLWARRSGAGPAGSESANACAAADGSSYMIGYFSGTAAFGTLSLTSTGAIFLVKYSSNGTVTFAKKLDSSGQENGTCVATDGDNILIAGKFSSTFIIGNDTLVSGGSGAFAARLDTAGNPLWAAGSGSTNGSSAESTGFAIAGYYTVYLTGYFTGTQTFGTTSFSSPNSASDIFLVKLSQTITTGINDQSFPGTFMVYPNPANQSTMVNWRPTTHETVDLEIFDELGKEVYSTHHLTSNIKLHTQSWNNGIYFCRIRSSERIAACKFIVQH